VRDNNDEDDDFDEYYQD
jgi:hypothetical protein